MLADVLDKIRDAKTREDKISILVENDDWFLRFILKEAYSGKPKVRLPKVLPKATGDAFIDDTHQELLGVFSILNKQNSSKVIKNALERLFKLLEPRSAEIVLKILKRDLECGLTVALINKALPFLIETFEFPKYKKVTINKVPVYNNSQTMVVCNRVNTHDCICYKTQNSWVFHVKSGRVLKSLAYMNNSLDKFIEQLGIPLQRGLCLVGKLCSRKIDPTPYIKKDAVCTDILFAAILLGRMRAFFAQDSEMFKPKTELWEPLPFLHRLPIYEIPVTSVALVAEKYYSIGAHEIELRMSTDLLGYEAGISVLDCTTKPDFELRLTVPGVIADVHTRLCKYPINDKLEEHAIIEYLTVMQENGQLCIVLNGIPREIKSVYYDLKAFNLIGVPVEISCKGFDENLVMKSPIFVKTIDNMDWESVEYIAEYNQVI